MATSRHSRPVPTGLQPAPAPARARRRSRWPVAIILVAGLLALAWFDGGEEALRPIAEPVVLPEQAP